MIIFDNETDVEFDYKILNKFISDEKRDIELILLNDEQISAINKEYRQKDMPTDVLSFPLEDTPHAPLGSILISVQTAQKKAHELSHSLNHEISLLFIHGYLHLKGFDHEKDEGQMREEERKIIEKFSLPKSLIIRNEE